jgi:methylenetetrahydrofolate--tRNA-(uracil-5-)-methyltransferase
MIPGLENAEFLRLGQIHRNTYINGSEALLPTMAARRDSRIFFAGQLAGTEGYIENVASGLVAGVNAVRTARGEEPLVLPAETAIGALCRYVSTPQKHFAPMNINFGLLPDMNFPRRISKTEKQRLICERALELCRPALTASRPALAPPSLSS